MQNLNIGEALQHKINNKTKPIGALGALEQIALQIGTIQNTLTPSITKPNMVVFAGDHGIAATGKVNPYPQAVTAQMVLNFCQGGAAINVFTKQNNMQLTVVDAGVNYTFNADLPIIHAKQAMGTANYLLGDAIPLNTIDNVLEAGATIVQNIYKNGCNTIAFGEMGIGNTSSASLIMHHYTGIPVSDCVGKGTGTNNEQLATKITTLEAVATLHKLTEKNITGKALLSKIGGYEIAMMAGAFIKAAELNMLIIVDGFITTAALLCAIQINNNNTQVLNKQSTLLKHCIFSHCSGEQGHLKMLEAIGAKPLLNLGLRLGEGTGAAIALPIIQNAVAFLNKMASFESAGVSEREA